MEFAVWTRSRSRFPAYRRPILALLMLPGCAVGPDFQPSAASVQERWSGAEIAAALPSAASDEGRFWAGFGDPTLMALLAMADRQSLTLQQTAESIVQAREQFRVDAGGLLPSLKGSGSSTYSQPTFAGALQGQNIGATTDQLLGQMSWELDLWGKVRRTLASDRDSEAAAKAGLAAARVSLHASIASAYCNLRTTERRIAVATENLRQQSENERIAQVKFKLGATSELDFRQAEAQYEQTKSQLPQLQQSLVQYQYSVSVLIGQTPDYFARHEPAATGLPKPPRALPLGAPRDLLRRRPDVLQAELEAAAQSERIGIAEAALFPSFSLTGAFGFATTGKLISLFHWSNRQVQAGPGFTLPIFDRGQLAAQVRIEDSLFRQAVLNYQNQVLTAQQDVENGLASVTSAEGQLAALKRAEAAASRAAALARDQYRAGAVDYTTVSSAEQNRANAADSLVQAQGTLLQAYISTFRAVGGGWEPPPTDAVAARP